MTTRQGPGGRTRCEETGQYLRSIDLDIPDTATHRTCSYCEVRQPMVNFYRDRAKRFGHAYECKECGDLRKRQRIGMKLSADQLMVLQEISGCEVCGDDHQLGVDHNHSTGNVRGILCGRCNKGLGLLRDDPAILRNLAKYVEERDAS